MVPEPNDGPKPDDEIDDEIDDEDDETDDEDDEEPEPGTLYFGEDDGWTAQSRCSPTSRPSRQAGTVGRADPISLRPGPCPMTARAPVQRCVGAPNVCLQGSLSPEAPFLRGE
jgi:hypothetical protein